MTRLHSVFLLSALIGAAGCGSDETPRQPAAEPGVDRAVAPEPAGKAEEVKRPRPVSTRDGRFTRIPPDRIDTERREAAESFARRYEQSRAQGTFAILGDEATEGMRTSLTVQKQKEAQQEIEAAFGTFEALAFAEAWKVNASPGSTIYRFRATFTEGRPEIRVVHDERGRVSGFWIKPWRDSLDPPRPRKLPESQVNQALRDASLEFARSYLERRTAGVFEPLGRQATEEMRTALTPEVQQQTHAELQARFGEFQSLDYVEAYRLESVPGNTVFRFRGTFGKGRPEVRVTRNADGLVSGFWIKPWRQDLD